MTDSGRVPGDWVVGERPGLVTWNPRDGKVVDGLETGHPGIISFPRVEDVEVVWLGLEGADVTTCGFYDPADLWAHQPSEWSRIAVAWVRRR